MAEMVELKNIQKSFGSNHILKGVNMSIGKGEVVVILGPSGSGKTTLLRTINFLDAADEGSISVSGFEVDAKKHSKSQVIELRRKTAMVFQNYNLFANKTILENVMEGLVTVKKFKKSDAEAMSREILKKVGLEERCDFYPAQLSGGQQRAWYCTGGCNREGGGCVKWERSWNISMPSGSAASFVPCARFCSTARKCCREELW